MNSTWSCVAVVVDEPAEEEHLAVAVDGGVEHLARGRRDARLAREQPVEDVAEASRSPPARDARPNQPKPSATPAPAAGHEREQRDHVGRDAQRREDVDDRVEDPVDHLHRRACSGTRCRRRPRSARGGAARHALRSSVGRRPARRRTRCSRCAIVEIRHGRRPSRPCTVRPVDAVADVVARRAPPARPAAAPGCPRAPTRTRSR